MSDVIVELKSGAYNSQYRSDFASDNVSLKTAETWQEMIPAGDAADSARTLIVSNIGTDTIYVATSSDADPSQYHVIMPNTQKTILLPVMVPLKVKHHTALV